MLIVYYGTDPIAAREAVDNYINNANTTLEILETGEWPENTQDSQLFGNPSIYLSKNLIKDAEQDILLGWTRNASTLIILENNLTDKQIMALPKETEIKKFDIQGTLPVWLSGRVKKYGGKISPLLAKFVVTRLGINERKEIPSDTLWLLENEAKKLAAYTGEQEITQTDIEKLIGLGEGAAFSMVDAALAGNAKLAIAECEKLYTGQTDEAGVTLLLIGALADTLRGIKLLHTAQADKISANEISSRAKWPSWKIGKLQTMSRRVNLLKATSALEKLAALDVEIKQSGLPPRVVFELILSDLAK